MELTKGGRVRAPTFHPTPFRPKPFRPNLFVQSYKVRLGLDEKDWTKNFGRKGVGRKVGLPVE